MVDKYFKYWGKTAADNTYHLLAYHSLDVAAVGYQLLNKNQSLCKHLSSLVGIEKKDFILWFCFFLALHDIGKFSKSFQSLNPEVMQTLQDYSGNNAYLLRHDSMGFLLWNEVLRDFFIQSAVIQVPKGSKRRKIISHPVDHLMSAVTGHHGEPPKLDNFVSPEDLFDEEQDYDALKTYVTDVLKLFPKCKQFPECQLESMKLSSWWLSGLTVLCDWIGSNSDFFPYQSDEISLEKYWEIAKQQAEKALNSTGLLELIVAEELSLQQIIQSNHGEKIEPTPLQQLTDDITLSDTSHLFILEDVTGAGKTEAAVILAHRLMKQGHSRGVYFALPTMATANAMYTRMAKAYQHLFQAGSKPSLILAHAARDMSQEFRQSLIEEAQLTEKNYHDGTISAGTHCNQWLADSRKKSLLADIGVGTIDQALLAILPSKHQSLRLLGLLNKVLIVDEVHACDVYLYELLCALLRAHAASGGSAILLSATLPQQQRQGLLNAYAAGKKWNKPVLDKTGNDDYPLLTSFNEKGLIEKVIDTRDTVKRLVKVNLMHSNDEIESLFTQVVANNQCACWIRNTVLDARDAYERLKKRHPEWKIDLFHARFALGDRLDIENRVIKNFGKESHSEQRRGQILIATQVVEQSLDADWDELVTDLAPIDLVIQRAGRLRRHIRNKDGNRVKDKDLRGQAVLNILTPEMTEEPDSDWYIRSFKYAQNVYENHGQLWLTAKLLNEKGHFSMPDDARELIESVYGENAEEDIPQSLMDSVLNSEGSGKAEASIAKLNALKLELGYGDGSSNRWWDEAKTPTRLGDKTTTLYLAKWCNGQLVPWYNKGSFQWQLSSLSVRTYWINEEVESPQIPQEQVDACKNQLPAKGKWGVLVVLSENKEGIWQGEAINENAEPVIVIYSKESGLVVQKASA